VRIVVFGLAVSSSWGNGHATTFRALLKALHQRGHRIVFYEKNEEWYESNRDLPDPTFCDLRIFESWDDELSKIRAELNACDVAIVGSYFPFGTRALDEVLASKATVKAFYDIDTPITHAKLKNGGPSYLEKRQLPGLDLYLSFTGGSILQDLETRFGVKRARPLYCSFDPKDHFRRPQNPRFRCDLSYMGTHASDRQKKVHDFFLSPAQQIPDATFLLAGAQYPEDMQLPGNVKHLMHVSPPQHSEFYSASRFTLNLTRQDMVEAGYSPSVRLFEAAACGAAIITDDWPGLESFFEIGDQILIAQETAQIVHYLRDLDDQQLQKMGTKARDRVLEEHSSAERARQLEELIEEAVGRPLENRPFAAMGL
jgi:spore maturation protein CgeB